MQLKSNQKYWMLAEVQTDGRVKLQKSQKLVRLNQHKSHWQKVSSRDMARALNMSELIIK
jgi:hypothetical protein